MPEPVVDQLLAVMPYLCRLALHLTERDDAEDLVMDTIERALRHWRRFDGRNLQGWLGTIMRNRALDLRRRAKFRARENLDVHPEVASGQDVERQAIAHLELEQLLSLEPDLMLALVPDRRRRARLRRARVRVRSRLSA